MIRIINKKKKKKKTKFNEKSEDFEPARISEFEDIYYIWIDTSIVGPSRNFLGVKY